MQALKKKKMAENSPRLEEASLIAQKEKKKKSFNLEVANVSTVIGTTFGLNPGYQNFSPCYAIVKWVASHFV